MTSIVNAWASNQAFMAWLTACLVAQGLKILGGVIRLRRFDFRWLTGTGGMPSTPPAPPTAPRLALPQPPFPPPDRPPPRSAPSPRRHGCWASRRCQ